MNISYKGVDLTVGEVYRPPNTNVELFLEEIKQIMTFQVHKNVLIGTDQNINLLNYDSFGPVSDLLEILYANEFQILIDKPTRVTHSTSTLIDNIYFKSGKFCEVKSCVICDDVSDHYPCLTNIRIKHAEESAFTKICKRGINEKNTLQLSHYLLFYNWYYLYTITDVNRAYDYVVSVISEGMDLFMPKKEINICNKQSFSEPWMTVLLSKFNKKQRKLHKLSIADPSEKNVTAYKRYRNSLNRIRKFNKREFYEKLFLKNKSNAKTTWSVLNSLMKKNTNRLSIPYIVYNNQKVTEPEDICEVVNNHFATAGVKQSKQIKKCGNLSPLDTVKRCMFNLSEIHTTEFELNKIVIELKSKNSCGHDDISNNLLKKIFPGIRQPLTYVFNLSLSSGEFPKSLKIAKVMPLLKSSPSTNCDNLRPISLLPVISKLLEKVVFRRTMSHIADNKLLYFRQFGFRHNHSTSDAIVDLLGEILSSWEKNMNVIAVFIDLKKAFDTVSHNILLMKLEKLGIRGALLEWYKNYFNDRKQFCIVNDTKSEMSNITIGVLQGSLLGVLCFQIHINDMYKCLKYSQSILYADDTTLLLAGRNLKFLLMKLQHDLDNLAMWLSANMLSLNVAKTKCMYFSRDPYYDTISLTVNGEQIELVDEFKFLGFYIDKNLSCETHLLQLHAKLLKTIFLLSKLSKFVTKPVLKLLYFAHFDSRLNYASEIYTGLASGSLFAKIEKIQKRAVRIVCRKNYHAPTQPLFKELSVLKLKDSVLLKQCILLHRIVYDTAPLSIKQLFKITGDEKETRSKNVIVLKNTQNVVNRSFLIRSVSHWNHLTINLKSLEHRKLLKRSLKRKLLDEY